MSGRLGNTGEVFRSTLSNIKLAGADADRISKLASRLSTHAQNSMQSIIQSRRVAEAIPQQSAQSHRKQFEPPWGAYQLMVIGTSISLWRYLAQSQVDSQTQAERLVIYLDISAGEFMERSLSCNLSSKHIKRLSSRREGRGGGETERERMGEGRGGRERHTDTFYRLLRRHLSLLLS